MPDKEEIVYSEEYIRFMLATGYDPLRVLNELFDIRELLWL